MDYGPAMRAARIKAGLTQKQLAEAIYQNIWNVGYAETGGRYPTIYYCEDCADALGISIDEFIGLEHKPVLILHSPRHHRLASGLTLAELAAKAGVCKQTILHVESHRHVPSIDTVVRLAHALGVGVDDYVSHAVAGETPVLFGR